MPDQKNGAWRGLRWLLVIVMLSIMYLLALGSSLGKSPTFDEGFYIARGWAFLRTGRLLVLGHPPLTNILSGLTVLLEPNLPAPATLPGWLVGDPEAFSEALLWGSGLNVERVVFLARLPMIWLGMLLAALVYRWAREDYSPSSGLLALALFAYSPSILAHTRLATTDLGVAAFYVAAIYTWTRYLRRGSLGWLAATGLFFGLAQASKFSALLLAPTLGLIGLWVAWRSGPLRAETSIRALKPVSRLFERLARLPLGWLWTAAAAGLTLIVTGLIALWASYLFTFAPYPLGQYVTEFRHFFGLASEGHRAYMMGRFSGAGWWYYHPFVLVVKSTLPMLALLLLALVLAVGRSFHRADGVLLLGIAVYLGASMVTTLNVGVRYLLPILPLLFIFISRIPSGPRSSGWLRPILLTALTLAHMMAAYSAYPNYLAYFNLIAGGSANGSRLLADSNLDWGQDLPGLAEYIAQHGEGKPLYLSYFGQADPTYYGIDATLLPGWPPPPPDPDRPPFYPLNPAPGLYAISASNLVGVQLHEPDSFGYFRAREPIANIGGSIFIYDVPFERTVTPTWFGQCAAPEPSETEAEIARLTGVDDLRHQYFDCSSALPIPPDGPGWLLLQDEYPPVADLGPVEYLARNENGAPLYDVWRVDAPPAAPPAEVEFPPLSLPIPIAGHVFLLGYEVNTQTAAPGDVITITEWWRVGDPPPPPVSIFAHLRGVDDAVLAAGDALGVPAEDWLSGMEIVQRHVIVIPPDIIPGTYTLAVGLYALPDGTRFPVSQSGGRVVDSIILQNITIESP